MTGNITGCLIGIAQHWENECVCEKADVFVTSNPFWLWLCSVHSYLCWCILLIHVSVLCEIKWMKASVHWLLTDFSSPVSNLISGNTPHETLGELLSGSALSIHPAFVTVGDGKDGLSLWTVRVTLGIWDQFSFNPLLQQYSYLKVYFSSFLTKAEIQIWRQLTQGSFIEEERREMWKACFHVCFQ